MKRFLVPKLLLGNPLGRKAPLCEVFLMSNTIRLLHQEVTKHSLGYKCVPKQELGNEGYGGSGLRARWVRTAH